MNKPKSVDQYIKNAPEAVQPKLIAIRKLIKSSAPKAEEKISYGMPYYGYGGRLVYFAYAKKHIGLYVMPKFLEDFKDEVREIKTGAATLRLPLDQKLPSDLIKKILVHAVKMIEKNK